jgi:hypothetical protein
MTAQVISLNRIVARGTTLIWRGLKHRLSDEAAFKIAEEIGWLLQIPGQSALHGFLLTATRESVEIKGWDMGPATINREEAIDLALELAMHVAPEVAKELA